MARVSVSQVRQAEWLCCTPALQQALCGHHGAGEALGLGGAQTRTDHCTTTWRMEGYKEGVLTFPQNVWFAEPGACDPPACSLTAGPLLCADGVPAAASRAPSRET